jgi:type I restriction enzyme S subunit
LCAEVRESIAPGDVDSDTPYIGLEHIPRRSVSLAQWGHASSVNSQKYRYRRGDILFGKIRPYFHKVGIAFNDGITSSDAIVIRPVSGELRSFVLMLVSSDGFVAEVAQTMREGSKMPRADWKLMTGRTIAVPPSGLLGLFSGAVTGVTDQLRTLALSNDRLRAARDLLLPRLMSGELVV